MIFIIDIREQFPLLPLEETIVIADELGLKHPTIRACSYNKMKEELLKEQVIEKLEIAKF